MSRVLMLSAHVGRLDRRIAAEANTLVRSGRAVTLLSAPIEPPGAILAREVELVAAGGLARARYAGRLRSLPQPLLALIKPLRYRDGHGPARRWADCFRRLRPPGDFDVIHAHDLDTLSAAVELRGQRPGARIIYDAHELYPHQFRSPRQRAYWNRIEQRYIHEADAVITVNESVAAKLADFYDVDPPQVIYNSYGVLRRDGVSLSDFLAHFGAPAGLFKIIFPGTLARAKNVEALVLAFEALGEGYGLFLLGDGPQASALRRRVARRRIDNVFFGSAVPQEDLVAYIAHADLGVIPYTHNGLLNNTYCTPNKLFEFIEAGVPICASDLPELRKLVAGNQIGLVRPMETPGQIAAALAEAREGCRMGIFRPDALREARRRFGWDLQAARLLALYENLGV